MNKFIYTDSNGRLKEATIPDESTGVDSGGVVDALDGDDNPIKLIWSGTELKWFQIAG